MTKRFRILAKQPKFRKGDALADGVAGLTAAVALLPDAMAAAVLVGVSPLLGLYGAIVGIVIGSLTTSSVFMCVIATGALSVAAREALSGLSGDERVLALGTLTLLVGAIQLVMGLLRFGSLTRFVSNSVMTGFLAGVGVLIVLSQLAGITGYQSPVHHYVVRAVDTLRHVGKMDIPTLCVGIATIGLAVAVGRTRLAPVAMLLALASTAIAVHFLGWTSVELVGDSGAFSGEPPRFGLPALTLLPRLALPALGLAIIGLVQGAGVGQSHPNPDGRYPNVSRDFVAQGIANVGSSLVRGLPVGGSVGGTALVVAAGARTRRANLATGIFAALAIALLGPAVAKVPVAALAGLLTLAGIRAFDIERITSVLRTGWPTSLVAIVTFAATLALPLQLAVLVGVLLSVVVYVVRSVDKLRLKEVVLRGGWRVEVPAPAALPDDHLTILQPYGSLFFAGACAFEDVLPDPSAAHRPVVLLELRGREDVGSTFLRVIVRYAHSLQARGGKLLLVGVGPRIRNQLVRTHAIDDIGAENVFPSDPRLGASFLAAQTAAQTWLSKAPKSP